MKEIRITLSSDDFAVVSESMIRLGVRFQVEPLVSVEAEQISGPAPAPKRRQPKRKGRSARSAGASAGSGAASQTGSGAARLRAIVERNRSIGDRPGDRNEADGEPDDSVRYQPPSEST